MKKVGFFVYITRYVACILIVSNLTIWRRFMRSEWIGFRLFVGIPSRATNDCIFKMFTNSKIQYKQQKNINETHRLCVTICVYFYLFMYACGGSAPFRRRYGRIRVKRSRGAERACQSTRLLLNWNPTWRLKSCKSIWGIKNGTFLLRSAARSPIHRSCVRLRRWLDGCVGRADRGRVRRPLLFMTFFHSIRITRSRL